MALDVGKIDLHDIIRVRLPGKFLPPEGFARSVSGEKVSPNGRSEPLVETTVGRVIFNESFPLDFEYVNHHVQKGDVATIVDQCVSRFDRAAVETVLDHLKHTGC